MSFVIRYKQYYYDGQSMQCYDLHDAVCETEEEVLEWLAQTNADVRQPKLERYEDYGTRKVYDISEEKVLRSGLLDNFKVDKDRVDIILKERQHAKNAQDVAKKEEAAIKKKDHDLKKLAELKKEYE